MAAARRGADRQAAHEWLREASLQAWAALREGAAENPLPDLLAGDARFRDYLTPEQIRDLLDAGEHVGTVGARARQMVAALRAATADG
jgi:adenylosuccinate lyase